MAAEFFYGVAWANATAEVTREVREFLGSFEILRPTLATVSLYGRLRAEMRRAGRSLPDPDFWIVAHVLEERLPLVSTDHHFRAFPELDLHLLE